MQDRSAGRQLSPEMAVSWSFPSDVQMSPDGCRVLFVVKPVADPDDHRRSSIWLAQEGEKERRLTHGPWSDTHPRWSPDGSVIGFLSDRKEVGKHQLFTMRTASGEAILLQELAGEILSFEWSPDGKSIVLRVKDGETAEEKERKEARKDEVVLGENLKFARIYVIPATGGDPIPVGHELRHAVSLAWLPGSDRIAAAFVASPLTNDEGYGPTRIYALASSTNAESREICRLDAGVEQLLAAPDGTMLAFRSKAGSVQVEDALWTVPLCGGEPICATRGYAGSVHSMVWSADSCALTFVATEDLWGALRSVDVKTGCRRDWLPESESRRGSFGETLSVSRDGTKYAVVRSFSDRLPEVWLGAPDGPLSPITQLNPQADDYRFVAAEAIEWVSCDGLRISGLLYRPPSSTMLCPLVVNVHGGPAWHWADRFLGTWHDWAQLLVSRGYAVLLPNPRGSTGRSQEFTDAEVDDMGGGELDDILAGVDHVLGLGFADPERVAIAGWSHGGYLTAWSITQTDRFKAAVVGAGVINLVSDHGQNDIPGFNASYYTASPYEDPKRYWQRSPMAHIQRARTPTLILHGERDERVTVAQAHELHRALKTLGVETQLVVYPREGHRIGEREHQLDLIERLVAWLDRHLQHTG